jgi:hypothetical protein
MISILHQQGFDPLLPAILRREFTDVAVSIFDDNPEAPSIRVVGVDLQSDGSLVIKHSGVPLGSRVENQPMTDGPTTIALLTKTWRRRSLRWRFADKGFAVATDARAELRQEWPGVFDCEISSGAGWSDLIAAVADQLSEIGELAQFAQVKQKYGGLRLLGGPNSMTGVNIVALAETLSEFICETCGAPGTLAGEAYLTTLCNRHRRHGV